MYLSGKPHAHLPQVELEDTAGEPADDPSVAAQAPVAVEEAHLPVSEIPEGGTPSEIPEGEAAAENLDEDAAPETAAAVSLPAEDEDVNNTEGGLTAVEAPAASGHGASRPLIHIYISIDLYIYVYIYIYIYIYTYIYIYRYVCWIDMYRYIDI